MEEELISEMEIEQCGEMKNQSDRKKTKKKQNRKAKPPKEPVACKYCGKQFSNEFKTVRHEKGNCPAKIENATRNCTTSKNRHQFSCKICDQTFKYHSGLLKHEQRHEPPGGFHCKHCTSCFTSELDRAAHREFAHKIFKCLICEKKFDSKKDYIGHIRELHNGKTREFVVCSDCGSQFQTPSQLKYHINSKCGTLKTFACDHCGLKYMTQNTLNAHRMIHTGEKKHLCGYCGNSFLSKGQLKVHERLHTGEKPFKCEICPKAFAYRESLVTHSSLHTGIKPYLCEGCGSRFSCIGNLIKHRRSRPDSCGLPQFKNNTKIAPRPSAKNQGSFIRKCPEKSRSKLKQLNCFVMYVPVTTVISKSSNGPMSVSKSCTTSVISTSNSVTNNSIITDSIQTNSDANKVNNLSNIETLPAMEYTKPNIQSSETQLLPEKFEEPVYCPYAKQNEITISTTCENDEQYNSSNSKNNKELKDESENMKFEKIMNDLKELPENQDNQHTFLSNPESMEIVSNVEIEYVTSEGMQIAIEEVVGDTSIGEVDSTDIKDTEYDSENFEINFMEELVPHDTETYEDTWQSDTVYQDTDENIAISYSNLNELSIKEDIEEKQIDDSKIILPDDCIIPVNQDMVELVSENEEGTPLSPLKVQLFENHDIVINESQFSESEKPIEMILEEIDSVPVEKQKPLKKKKIITKRSKALTKNIKHHEEPLKRKKVECTIGVPTYECSLCPKQYFNRKPFIKHLAQMHNFEEVKTEVRKKNTAESIDNSTKPKPEFSCPICNRKYFSNIILTKHLRVHGENGFLIYKCSCCRQWFETNEQCLQHEKTEHKDKLYCSECNKTFKEPDNLTAHFRYAHSKDSIQPKKYLYVCPRCGRKFSSKVALSDHERSNCGSAPIYKCDMCNKCYHSAGSLKTHQTIHTGELPHVCKYCAKAFRTHGQVKVHERKHNGEKPFKCEFCVKTFAYRESLLTHISLHTGLKRFMCSACNSRFSCISNLQAHRKSHKNSCGKHPNVTKAVGPMGADNKGAINNLSSG